MNDSRPTPAPGPGNDKSSPTVAVILPVFNEAKHLEKSLSELLAGHPFDEVIVVDGGSTDASVEIVCKLMSADASGAQPVPYLIQAPRGRARQMHAGAQVAGADVLLFLHADTALPSDAVELIRTAIRGGYLYGRFDVRLSGRHFLFRIIERLMNWRSRVSGIVTGDQGLFVRLDVYRMLGGFAPIALMEDIHFSARLKWVGKPACLRGPAIASSRRWEERGILRTVLSMWMLRFLYWLGVSPARLARWYDLRR
jgi:rSAM/selenodomain-associated transferase 2